MRNILIVEDDRILNETLAYNLEIEGYRIKSVYNFEDSLIEIRRNIYDLIILDINLPDGNGMDICRKIREEDINTYIIFLTANDTEKDMIKGYEVGGSDYITKPFSITVLIKKISAIFRRFENRNTKIYDDGILKIDFEKYSSILNNEQVEFTSKEYRTLYLFIKNPRIILSKRMLLEKLWDNQGDFVDEHTLTTTISRIRKKIENNDRKYIKTSYGLGYQWLGENKYEII